MKRCPQCRAEYEDHVQFCFVDGTELRPMPPQADPSTSPGPRTSNTDAGEDGLRGLSAEADAGAWARPVTGMVGMALTAIGGIGIVALAIGVLLTSLRGQTNTSGDRIDLDFVPSQQGEVPSMSSTTAARMIHFESDPPGASVQEADQQLCTTPCEVAHPDYAPRVRTFVLKAKGYAQVEVEVRDAKSPEIVRLKQASAGQRPTERPRDAPDILPHR